METAPVQILKIQPKTQKISPFRVNVWYFMVLFLKACVIEGHEKRYQRCEKWFSIVNFSYVEIIIIGRQKAANIY